MDTIVSQTLPTPEEQRATEAKLKAQANALDRLINYREWKVFEDLINAHINNRAQNVWGPTKAGEELVNEHNKGVVFGLLFARDLPAVTVNATKSLKVDKADDDEGE